jgi:hypothetical protein
MTLTLIEFFIIAGRRIKMFAVGLVKERRLWRIWAYGLSNDEIVYIFRRRLNRKIDSIS